MADSLVSRVSDRLQYLETLYPVLLNLTVKAQEKHDELDKQSAIEEMRTNMLAEASRMIDDVRDSLNRLPDTPENDIHLEAMERTISGFIALLQQVHEIDQARVCAFRQEWETLQKTLHDIDLGKQAVSAYQRSSLLQS